MTTFLGSHSPYTILRANEFDIWIPWLEQAKTVSEQLDILTPNIYYWYEDQILFSILGERIWDFPHPPRNVNSLQNLERYLESLAEKILGLNPLQYQQLLSLSKSQYRLNITTPEINPLSGEPITFDLPVVGYRGWSPGVNEEGLPELLPANTSYGAWVPGNNHAVCRANHSHTAASTKYCHCGFYFLHDIENAYLQVSSGIFGAVVGWGQIIEHRWDKDDYNRLGAFPFSQPQTEGWRTEYAKILALYDPSGILFSLHFLTLKYWVYKKLDIWNQKWEVVEGSLSQWELPQIPDELFRVSQLSYGDALCLRYGVKIIHTEEELKKLVEKYRYELGEEND